MGVVVLACFGDPNIADDSCADRSRRGLRTIEVGVRAGGRPGRDLSCIGADLERRFLACSAGRESGRRFCQRCGGSAGPAQFIGAQFRRQGVPFELRFDAVGSRTGHCAPVVDAAGRAGRNAGHAEIADARVDHIVAGVMRDGADRAGRLAGVATDADFGIDQVLPDDLGLGRAHHAFTSRASLRAKRSNPGERRTPDDSWIASLLRSSQ